MWRKILKEFGVPMTLPRRGVDLVQGIHYVGYGLGNIVGKKRTNLLEENIGKGTGFGES